MQVSVAIENAMLDAMESTTGVSPVMRIRTGSEPNDCAAARTGTVLATLTLPADWMANAAISMKSLLGTWEDSDPDAIGTAGHFEIMESTLTTCHFQGSVSLVGGGGDMTIDDVEFAPGKPFAVTTFTIASANS